MNGDRKPVSDEQALQRFVMDLSCLDALSEWSCRRNLFDILDISRTEIRHSNFLRWLLDPNENHGLGGGVLAGLLKKLAPDAPEIDVFQVLLMDLSSVQVLREWRHIDLLAISHKERFLLAIENKVDAGEGDGQLSRYQSVLEEAEAYREYNKVFVFLTPDGRPPERPSDQETWLPLSYTDLIGIIEVEKGKVQLPDNSAFLIDQYIDTVRRHIMGDKRLEEICRQIYAEHRQALDLIYEHRFDSVARVAEIAGDWCRKQARSGNLAFDPGSPANSGKTCVRFTTPFMTELLPELEEANGEWKTRSIYYYEVMNHGDYIKVVLTVASKNLSEAQRDAVNALSDRLGRKDKKPDWSWKRLKNWSRHPLQADPMSEELEKEVCDALNEYWKEIVRFEKEISERLK